MTHLFVIPGHGAGDSGAVGNGYQEQERVRALATRIKELGGDSVTLADFGRNYYADNGISRLDIPGDWQIIELHMDSASATARGGHVIIWGEYEPDEYDNALADFIAGIFPGRSQKIVGRTDLANPARAANRGYGYRLVENGFISNAGDVATFNSRMDEIAKGYLSVFGISAVQQPSADAEKSIDELAREVIKGRYGNGEERRQRLGDKYDAVQARVDELLGKTDNKPAPEPEPTPEPEPEPPAIPGGTLTAEEIAEAVADRLAARLKE